LFEKDPILLTRPYEVRSSASAEALRGFLEIVQGRDIGIEITSDIRESMNALSREFEFEFDFDSDFCLEFGTEGTQGLIHRLEERIVVQGRVLESIRADLRRLQTLARSIGDLKREMESVKSGFISGAEAIRNETLSEISRIESQRWPPGEVFWPSKETAIDSFVNRIKLTRSHVNVLLFGSHESGKIELAECLLKRSLASGDDFVPFPIVVRGKEVQLNFWDMAGQEMFRSISQLHFHNAGAVLILYNTADPESFNSVSEWLDEVHQWPEKIPVLIVAWDKKLAPSVVPASKGRALAQREKAFFAEFHADPLVIGTGLLKFFEAVSS
jgi:hypothetical protein